MAYRTTEAAVKELMVNTSLTEDQLTPFLDAASQIVDNLLLNEGYGDGTLELIEMWLCAHLASGVDPGIVEEQIDDAKVKYEGKLGEGMSSTRFGQRLRLLEYKGLLDDADKIGGPAEVEVIL